MLPNRSGKTGRYFIVLNSASELSRVRDNSDYAELVIMPSSHMQGQVRPLSGACCRLHRAAQ